MAETETAGFVCRRCGACCRWPGHVRVSERDLDRLARALEWPVERFIDRYTELTRDRRGLSLIEQEDGSCLFLEGNRCRLYDARPDQCRNFPLGWTIPGGCARAGQGRAGLAGAAPGVTLLPARSR